MSKDTIYREDAIKAYNEAMEELVEWQMEEWQLGDFSECEFNTTDCKHIVRKLEAIPSADRPQGEWIDAEIPLESGGSMPIQACNLCKTFYPLAYTGGGHRFCPNCGAKMKGADDEMR